MSQAPKSMAPTFPLSIVNLLGDPVRKPLLRIDAERVTKLAERLTGLHDYGLTKDRIQAEFVDYRKRFGV